MKNSVLMRSFNTLYFRQNNSLILKLTSGQRKKHLMKSRKTVLSVNVENQNLKSDLILIKGRFKVTP
jgi:hypothetical protein